MLKLNPVGGLPLDSLAKSGFPLLICRSVFLHTNFFTSSILMRVMSVSLLNKHNRLAWACPVSNLSSVFRLSIKREIGIREEIT